MRKRNARMGGHDSYTGGRFRYDLFIRQKEFQAVCKTEGEKGGWL